MLFREEFLEFDASGPAPSKFLRGMHATYRAGTQ
jgi:hypothetical protein